MAVSDKIDICNLALSELGVTEPIVTIDAPTSPNEKLCAAWYDQCREDVLSMHPWNFARSRFNSPGQAAPAFGYTNSFALPSDYLRLVWIGKTRQDFKEFYSDYAVEGLSVLLDYDQTGPLPLVYIRNEERVGVMSPWFKNCMVLYMALRMSNAKNKNSTDIQELSVRFDNALKSATQRDGQESQAITVMRSNYKSGTVKVNTGFLNG